MTKILIIYTGGTIGMVNDPLTGALIPFDFKQIRQNVPELARNSRLISLFGSKSLRRNSMSDKQHYHLVAGYV